MSAGVVLATSVMVPFICLGMLMWLAWLEDTLVEDVKKGSRRNSPHPVVAVPVKAQVPVRPVATAPADPSDDEPRFAVAS